MCTLLTSPASLVSICDWPSPPDRTAICCIYTVANETNKFKFKIAKNTLETTMIRRTTSCTQEYSRVVVLRKMILRKIHKERCHKRSVRASKNEHTYATQACCHEFHTFKTQLLPFLYVVSSLQLLPIFCCVIITTLLSWWRLQVCVSSPGIGT